MTSKYDGLVEKCPNLYRDYNGIFDVGDGWFDLINVLSIKLDHMIALYRIEHPEDLEPSRVLQIKEKFGGLRFYLSKGTDEMQDLISRCEKACGETCEICGVKGRLYSINNWLKTLCPPCLHTVAWKDNEVS